MTEGSRTVPQVVACRGRGLSGEAEIRGRKGVRARRMVEEYIFGLEFGFGFYFSCLDCDEKRTIPLNPGRRDSTLTTLHMRGKLSDD